MDCVCAGTQYGGVQNILPLWHTGWTLISHQEENILKHLLVVVLFCAGYISNITITMAAAPQKKPFTIKLDSREAAKRSFSQLHKQVRALNDYIGGYPPRFKDENERQEIYTQWLDLVSDAEAFARSAPGEEKTYYILAELYRQGHNMDVKGSGARAQTYLNSCLASFPASVSCNFSATYFYLSVGAGFLDNAENSLKALRTHFAPELNSEVEAGYVYLYIYRKDVDKARKQIDKFIRSFPHSERMQEFSDIKAHLNDKIKVIHNGD